MDKTKSVKGLENISQLLSRNPQAAAVEPPKSAAQKKQDQNRIVMKTISNLKHIGIGDSAGTIMNIDAHNHGMLVAAVREAYDLGHRDTLDQNNAVEVLLNRQYEERTKLTTPAVVAAVMEQMGMSSMLLDLALVATVFKRCAIEYTVTGEPGAEIIEYRLKYLADGGA